MKDKNNFTRPLQEIENFFGWAITVVSLSIALLLGIVAPTQTISIIMVLIVLAVGVCPLNRLNPFFKIGMCLIIYFWLYLQN